MPNRYLDKDTDDLLNELIKQYKSEYNIKVSRSFIIQKLYNGTLWYAEKWNNPSKELLDGLPQSHRLKK